MFCRLFLWRVHQSQFLCAISRANRKYKFKGTIRGLTAQMRIDDPEMHVSPATTQRWFKLLHGNRKKQWVHPTLTVQQKLNRAQFVQSKIGENGMFNPQFGVVHVDEAWFYKVHNGWYTVVVVLSADRS